MSTCDTKSAQAIIINVNELVGHVLKKYCRPAGDFIQFTNCLNTESTRASYLLPGRLTSCHGHQLMTPECEAAEDSRHDYRSYLEGCAINVDECEQHHAEKPKSRTTKTELPKVAICISGYWALCMIPLLVYYKLVLAFNFWL
jgi:hypothetical protein